MTSVCVYNPVIATISAAADAADAADSVVVAAVVGDGRKQPMTSCLCFGPLLKLPTRWASLDQTKTKVLAEKRAFGTFIQV